ncbi:hypothetical protein O7621_26165 [Solwaraspora sp. WMMD937]|uniref:hypothetical protein n=1 Tax=Solwaraspora sp. WMMD937 TaxID=3016090 RepID=UPI00249C4EB3|nr:hypothetical protein [Solwaraspora sp. WMMD937]WFE21293.1 hypothetical protein O7621_26165 [Solwaraspora sp. WMMD937]
MSRHQELSVRVPDGAVLRGRSSSPGAAELAPRVARLVRLCEVTGPGDGRPRRGARQGGALEQARGRNTAVGCSREPAPGWRADGNVVRLPGPIT